MISVFRTVVSADVADLRGLLEVFEGHVHGQLSARSFNAFVATLCASFEALLHSRAVVAGMNSDWRLDIAREPGRGLRRLKTFLKKRAKVTVPTSMAEWQRLVSLCRVRNVVVHADGDGYRLQPHERTWLEREGCLASDVTREVRLTPAFLRARIDDTERFLYALDAALPADLQNA